MSNICPCIFVEDQERKEMIFLERKVIVTYFDTYGRFSYYVGILDDVDNSAVYLNISCSVEKTIVYVLWDDVIDIQLTD